MDPARKVPIDSHWLARKLYFLIGQPCGNVEENVYQIP